MSSPPSPQAHPSPPPMTSSPSDLVPFMAIVGGLAAVVLVATAVYCFVVHSQGTRKMTDIRAKAEEWSTSTQEVELSSAMDMELNDPRWKPRWLPTMRVQPGQSLWEA